MKPVGLLILGILILLGGLTLFSRKLLYFPTTLDAGRLEHIHQTLENAEELLVPVGQGIVLHGWILKKDMKNLPFVFYFGGNAEEISLNLEKYQENLNANVVMVNYRGYGKSKGSPKEDQLKSDALILYDTIKDRFNLDPTQTIAWGRSLGSSIASYLAFQRNLKGLILTCPFDSIENVAASYYPAWLVKLVLKDRHRTTDFCAKIKAKTLVLTAGHDEVIPQQRTRALYDGLTCDKKQVIIHPAGHNTISEFKEYFQAVNRFFLNFPKASSKYAG